MKVLLSTAQVAKLLGLSPQTLRLWRCLGKGPRYLRFGGLKSRAFYCLTDIDDWMQAHRYISTSEETVKRSETNVCKDE